MAQDNNAAIKNVVLVHGGFADGSGWRPVYDLLVADGYTVRASQHATITLDGDVDTVRDLIETLDGPVLLVGHSYGGAVITLAGNHPQVAGLVYITAFAPDEGESVFQIASTPVEGATPPPFLPSVNGFMFLDADKFAGAFAQDLDPKEGQFMGHSQVPWGEAAAAKAITNPAWRTKPVHYLITTEDHMIAPPAQEKMAERAGATVRRTAASHSVFLSQPEVVADIIKDAAQGA